MKKYSIKQIDKLCNDAANLIKQLQAKSESFEKLHAEKVKLRNLLEIVRRYAIVEYAESASCRIIASEIQKEFPLQPKKE